MNLATFHPSTASDAQIRLAQKALGVKVDGDFGPKSFEALAAWRAANFAPATDNVWHPVMASSFADPADIAAFRRRKAAGDTDQQAFKYGDNGIGVWGDDCSQGSGPKCALPPEIWHQRSTPHLAKVDVQINSRIVTAQLADTMPSLSHIKNGAGIDLNYDLCVALHVSPPLMVKASWRWSV